MKTISQILEIIENRVRNFAKMKLASKDIDQRRKKAPLGWNSIDILHKLRQAQR